MSSDNLNKLAAERVKRHIPKYKRPAPKLPSLPDDRHAAERKLLDELLGPPGGGRKKRLPRRRSLEHIKRPGGSGGGSGSGGSRDPHADGSNDLITKMAARLAHLEKAQYRHRDEMVRKDREILKLKRRVEALQSVTDGREAAVSEIENLRSENLQLKQQIHEMETFLNDYGLVWVGDLNGGKQQQQQSSNSAPSSGAGAGAGAGAGESDSAPVFQFDSTLMMERVKQLNTAAGEGKHEVAKVRGVHKFQQRESVKIAVYRDGIFIRRGPFRPFTDKKARMFVQDILDGYFPSEFKDQYPDGVVLDVKDKTGVDYDPTRFKAFSGKGAAIGDAPTPSNIHSLADVGGAEFQLRKQDFLNALPASVLKGGKVIEVRAGVEKHLAGGKEQDKPKVVLVQTPVVEALQDESGRPITPADVATLRIKSETGRQTLVVKLRYDDTIADVRRFVDEHRTETTPYELRTSFPRKAYTDPQQTLRDAGLIPNATLIISPAET